MIEVGALDRFGFRIGPASPEAQVRQVSIFIAGTDLTRYDNSVFLPLFVDRLKWTSAELKRKIDYLRFSVYFGSSNVSQIHNLLLHGDPGVFADETEWWVVSCRSRFAEWGETTDDFAAFLIPYDDRLHLTYQFRAEIGPSFERLDVVDGIETTPYELIRTIDAAVEILEH